jgi:hypothetical protein
VAVAHTATPRGHCTVQCVCVFAGSHILEVLYRTGLDERVDSILIERRPRRASAALLLL